jgi:hypothetical protein
VVPDVKSIQVMMGGLDLLLKDRFRVDMIRSPSRPGTPAPCAHRTAGVDVSRTLRIAALERLGPAETGPCGGTYGFGLAAPIVSQSFRTVCLTYAHPVIGARTSLAQSSTLRTAVSIVR